MNPRLLSGGSFDPVASVVNANFEQLFSGFGTSGAIYCVSPFGADTNDGLSWASPLLTIQAAVDKCGYYTGDKVFVAPGAYDETVTVLATKGGLTIVGCGNLGAVGISPSTVGAEGMLVRANDVTLINLGVAGEDDGDYALSFTGDRFRAYWSKFEGADAAVIARVGTVAEDAAGTDGSASDFMFQNCESAWTASGFICQSSDYGAVTQGRIINHLFHNCATVCLGENDISTIGAIRNLTVQGCVFGVAEDGTAPTDFIDLNSVGSTGLLTGNVIAFATNEADVIQLASGVLWVANMTEAGITTARPS